MMAGRTRTRTGALAAAALVVLAGCTGAAEPTPSPEPTPSFTATPSPTPEPDPWTSVIATATVDAVEVFADADAPTAGATVTAAEAVSLPDAVPLTFLVLEDEGDRLRVWLPTAPAGGTGWISDDDVTLTSTDYRLEVRLTEHRLLLHRADEVVLDAAVGIGTDEVPPPGEGYFLKELLQPPTPGGVYGVYAYGLSGFPPVLDAFAAGQGVIGIHGTNEPAGVGGDVAIGCIRLADADITRLVEEFGLPLGTPVDVVA